MYTLWLNKYCYLNSLKSVICIYIHLIYAKIQLLCECLESVKYDGWRIECLQMKRKIWKCDWHNDYYFRLGSFEVVRLLSLIGQFNLVRLVYGNSQYTTIWETEIFHANWTVCYEPMSPTIEELKIASGALCHIQHIEFQLLNRLQLSISRFPIKEDERLLKNRITLTSLIV